MDTKCAINPTTGRAIKTSGKVYKKIDSSAKKIQSTVRAKLTTKKPEPEPPKPKMKPKPSPKMDVGDDNWFLPYIEKEASQILQAVARRTKAMKKK
jgi:hypothetical protein